MYKEKWNFHLYGVKFAQIHVAQKLMAYPICIAIGGLFSTHKQIQNFVAQRFSLKEQHRNKEEILMIFSLNNTFNVEWFR